MPATTDLWARIKRTWNPRPSIQPPTVDPDIEELDAMQRAGESIRYSIMSLEFWISPKGQVREYLRHHTLAAALLAIPAVIVMPFIGLILAQLVSWLGMLVSLASHAIILPILGMIAVLVILLVIKLIKSLFGLK